MVSSEEWNKKECPHCGTPLWDGDFARVLAQVQVTEVGSVSLQQPEGWWELSCGHRVETVIDRRTPEDFNFKLTDCPEA